MTFFEGPGDVLERIALSPSQPRAPSHGENRQENEGDACAEACVSRQMQNDVHRKCRHDETGKPRPGSQEPARASFPLQNPLGSRESPRERAKWVDARLALGRSDGGAHGPENTVPPRRGKRRLLGTPLEGIIGPRMRPSEKRLNAF